MREIAELIIKKDLTNFVCMKIIPENECLEKRLILLIKCTVIAVSKNENMMSQIEIKN